MVVQTRARPQPGWVASALGLEGLPGARLAELPETLQVVGPVEVEHAEHLVRKVLPVPVPEQDAGLPVASRELEPDRAPGPRLRAGLRHPGHQLPRVVALHPHHGVEALLERERDAIAVHGHAGGPPSRQTLLGRQGLLDRRRWSLDLDAVDDLLHHSSLPACRTNRSRTIGHPRPYSSDVRSATGPTRSKARCSSSTRVPPSSSVNRTSTSVGPSHSSVASPHVYTMRRGGSNTLTEPMWKTSPSRARSYTRPPSRPSMTMSCHLSPAKAKPSPNSHHAPICSVKIAKARSGGTLTLTDRITFIPPPPPRASGTPPGPSPRTGPSPPPSDEPRRSRRGPAGRSGPSREPPPPPGPPPAAPGGASTRPAG